MKMSQKDKQMEVMWQQHEAEKITQQIIEKARLSVRVISEITAYEEYVKQEREAEAYQETIKIIQRLQSAAKPILDISTH